MAKVTALCMDTITKKSNHVMTPCAVSVCITPAAPSPLPIPYPVVANIAEGITDPPMRTKFDGAVICTVGSCFKTCHGNEPGTLKEVVSLNTAGPCFLILGAINVFVELGMAGITGSPGFMNKAITVGASGSASGAGGAGGGGGAGSGGSASSGGPQGPGNQSNGGGSGGGSNSGSSADRPAPGTSSNPADRHTCQNGHPVDVVSGAVVDLQTDIELPGLIPLKWRRLYHSMRANDRGASLGPGWAHSYEQRIDCDGDLLHLRDEEGRTLTFERVAAGASTFHRRERMWLHGETDGYRVERLDDRLSYRFTRFDADAPETPAWLTRIEDRRGNAVALHYDGQRLDHIVDTAGRRLQLSWGRHGGHWRINRLVVEARGRSAMSVSYHYAQSGCLISAVDGGRHVETYDYDERRRMVAATIKTGARFQYEYDDRNRCVRTWGPKGLYRVPLQYDEEHKRSYAGGEEPRIYDYNHLGRMTRMATPSGTVLAERAFDQDGYLIAEVDGEGEGTRYWYDELGNVTRVVDAADNETQYEYTFGRPTKRITADGNETHYQYDDAGALIGMRNAAGASFSIHRDERGRILAIDGPVGRLAAYEYDADHNLSAEWDSRGNKTRYAYDALGRLTRHIDPLERTMSVTRDAMGRRTAVFYPDGTQERFQLDAMGNVLERTDRLGQPWKYRYGGMGVVTEVTEPDGSRWRLSYTTFERLAAVVNPAGEQYTIQYDDAGRVASECAFDNRVLRYQYARSGKVARIDYDDGSSRQFRYDVHHNLVEERGSDNSRIELIRDALGRLDTAIHHQHGGPVEVRYERDALGRTIAERHDDSEIRYAWDVLGRRTSRVLPDGSTTYYEYDNEDELTALSHVLAGQFSHRVDFRRDSAGRASRLDVSSLYESRNEMTARFSLNTRYDDMDRLVEQRVDPATSPSDELRQAAVVRRYSHDRSGRVTQIDDQRWGRTEMRYDTSDRLLSLVRGEHREAYRYGRAGYIEAKLHALAGDARDGDTWEIGAGNQLLASKGAHYEYDQLGRRSRMSTASDGSDGEQVTHYHWDVRDQLVSVQLPDQRQVRFRYDAFGRRVSKELLDAAGERLDHTLFSWDGDDLCADQQSGQPLRSFVHHPHTGTPLLQAERGEVFTCVTDHVGVVKELIDDAGMVAWAGSYSAWGALLEEQADPASSGRRSWQLSCPFRLLGQYHDAETGLSYARFRYFDADTARWCSPDPLGIIGDLNPTSFDASPTLFTDPLGLSNNGSEGNGHQHREDYGSTPGGLRHTEHSRERADERNFSEQQIDAIVQNNRKSRVRQIDEEGRLTHRYQDARGNRVVLNDQGAIVSVHSTRDDGQYIPKRRRRR